MPEYGHSEKIAQAAILKRKRIGQYYGAIQIKESSMNENACAFTGHRPHKFPWKSNESDPRCTALKAVLAEQVGSLIAAGVTDFYSGSRQLAARVSLIAM